MTNENQAVELVKVENEQVVTTSLVVAESFGKKNKNIIQAVENLMAENQAVKNMFWISSYINSRGREYPMYYMNRDGFTLLVMGFTGKEALQFKVEYINAFNKMEEQLKNQVQTKVFSYMIDDPAKRARLWADEMDGKDELIAIEKKQNLLLENTIEEYKPKVKVYEQAMSMDGLHSMKEVAHLMDVGRNTLFAKMRDANILNSSNLPYQRYISSKYFTVKQTAKANGVYNITLVTQKGLDWLIKNKEAIMNSTFI